MVIRGGFVNKYGKIDPRLETYLFEKVKFLNFVRLLFYYYAN